MGSVWNSGVLGGLPTVFNESVQGGQEEIPTSFNETVQGGRETRHLEQSTSQVVGAQEVDHRYDVDGLLFQDSWLIGDNISVRYAIRYKKSDPSKAEVELGDVFIDLDDFRNLISIYQDEGTDEAIVPSVWTINVKDRKLRFCPLAEFVYQAAVFSNGGALSSQVFRGILELLLVNLLPDNPISNALISFKEINTINTINTKNTNSVLISGNKTQQTRQKKKLLKSCRKRKLSSEDSSDVFVQPIKERIGAEVVIKYEDECEISDNSRDANNESMLNDEAVFSSEEEIQTKERNNLNQTSSKARSRYQCAICESSFKKESTLYLHQVNKHPNDADLHIAKPTSLGNRVTRTTTECKVCGVELRGLTKEYKHYETSHPDFADRPSKPDYLVNKEIAKGDKARKETEATCRECFKEFATTKHLFNHCRREHPDLPEICPLEPVRLGPISSLHERACDQGDNGDQFKCGEPTCSLHFQRFLSLVDHERTGHPSCYICILCGLPCMSADSLISHSDNIHPKKSTFICRVCGFFNRNTRGLTIHTQQEHMKGTLTYQCEKCAYTSENYVTFGNHRRTAHLEDNSKFVCEECGNNFASKQSLSSHRRLHNPDFKKFECKYCPQKFGHSSVLLIHMRVHTGEKPFCCNICGATFGSQTASTRHRRVVHAGDSEMRFQCPDCGKKYPSRAKRDFENHCKTHSGVRDHVCDLCGSAYFSKKGLRKHERAAHPAQKPMKPKPFKISGDEAMAPTGPPETALLQPPSYEPRSHILLDRGEDPHGTGGHLTREDFLPGHVTRTDLDHLGHMQHQHLLQASRDGVLPAHQIDREVLSGPRAGDMNLQLAYAAALNRQQGDNRITQFFVPNTQVLEDTRGLPKECLHQLLLPQLQGYKMHYRTSRHIQSQLLAEKCSNLKRLEFSNCKSLQPIFFTKFLTKFPFLISLNLENTIIDDEAFSSIGQSCKNLRELNVSGSTISDFGLKHLIGSREDVRVPLLTSLSILNTKLSPDTISLFISRHTNLLQLRMDNMCLVFIRLKEHLASQGPRSNSTRLQLRSLCFSEGIVDEEGVEFGIGLCPFADKLTIRQTDLSQGILDQVRRLAGLSSLHLGNSSFSQHTINFKDGIVPVLANLQTIRELTLEKINKVDVLVIGNLCPKLRFLKLTCIGSYLPVFGNSGSGDHFRDLEELVILNTRGAHVFTKTLMCLVSSAHCIKHIRFQFVDTLNDEVWCELLSLNPLEHLQTVIFDQCHSVSIFTLDALLSRKNQLVELCVWSCRFITEEDRDTLNTHIRIENFALRFDWYPFTGEEAPMPIEDIEDDDESEDDDEDDDDEENPDFLNYWNSVPQPSQAGRFQQLTLD